MVQFLTCSLLLKNKRSWLKWKILIYKKKNRIMVMEKRNLNTPNLWRTQRSRRVKGVGQPEQLLSCGSSGGVPLACNLIGQKYVSICFRDGANNHSHFHYFLNPSLCWYWYILVHYSAIYILLYKILYSL